jgi:hypothetical protein
MCNRLLAPIDNLVFPGSGPMAPESRHVPKRGDRQFPLLELPLKLPNILICNHLSFQITLLPGLPGDTEMCSGMGKLSGTHNKP